MQENNIQPEVIDLRVVARKVWGNRKLFYKVLPIAFVLSSIYIFCQPRYYMSEAKLAPELDNSLGGVGALGDIASSFGIDLGSMQTSDAITPLLYPDLMDDNGFVASMFGIQVKSQDGEINTRYYDYLKKYQKKSILAMPFVWITQKVIKLFSQPATGPAEFDPYNLSKKDDAIVEKIRDNVVISVDKQTAVISIKVTAQDPYIAKTLTDSIKEKLQFFITDYRTNKARTDYEYYKGLAADAKHEYEKARRLYGSISDANTKVALRSVELKMEDMENDMQLKFNAYTTLNTQLQAAKAKVQERTPAFTVIKGAAVPIKPAGPKRVIFVLGMLILTSIGCAFYVLLDDIKARIIG